MKTKEFIGTCVENPFDNVAILSEIIDNAREISKKTFLENCIVTEEQRRTFNKYPYDYCFYKNKNIYFYDFSAIEHFYA